MKRNQFLTSFLLLFLALPLRATADPLKSLTQVGEWLNTTRPLTRADFTGRVTLIDFWTFCCINCMHLIPDLQRLEKEFGDKLTVVGVHSAKFGNEREEQNIRSAMVRYGIEHPVVNDREFLIWNDFKVNVWPTLVLLSPNGEVLKTTVGEGHYEEWRTAIALAIKSTPPINSSPLPILLEKNKEPETFLKFPAKLAVANWKSEPVLVVTDSNHNRVLGLAFPKDGKNSAPVKFQAGSGAAGRQDGNFSQAQFTRPQGLAVRGDKLYVADTENHLVREIDLAAEKVNTLAGTGEPGKTREAKLAPALATGLNSPWDVAAGPNADELLIAMAGTHQLWSYHFSDKTLSVVAGSGKESIDDGAYPQNSLSQPSGLSVFGDATYFVDAESSALRKFANAKIETLIGKGLFVFGFKDGERAHARLQHPLGLVAEKNAIFVADSYNNSLRRFDLKTKRLSTLAGDGQRGNRDGALRRAQFNEPNAIVSFAGRYFVADTNNHAIRIVDVKMGKTSTLAVTPAQMPVDQSRTLVRTLSTSLPALHPEKDVVVASDKPILLALSFETGWKLNATAPSWVGIFPEGEKTNAIKVFDREELKKGPVTLPALESGKYYRLQGTFYYCKDAKGSVCQILSHDRKVQAMAASNIEMMGIAVMNR